MMRTILSLILVAGMNTPALVQAADKPDPVIISVLGRFVDDVLVPGYDQFKDASTDLDRSMKRLCNSPDKNRFEMARSKFGSIVSAWSRIELMREGPVNANNRFERILFYPDRKSTGLRQTIAIIRKKDQRALSISTLQKKSVATQGLGALEYVLFGKDSEQLIATHPNFRCGYGKTISANLNVIGTQLAAEWHDKFGVSKTWKNPGDANPIFRNHREALNSILGVLINNLRVIDDIRLGSFLRQMKDDDRPNRAIFRRSGNTFKSISTNIEALKMMFIKSDLQSLLSNDTKSISDSILFEFNQAIRVSQSIDLPVEEALNEPLQRKKLKYLSLVLKALVKRFDEEFSPATGLAAGFSFSDGD